MLVSALDLDDDPNEHFQRRVDRELHVTNMYVPHISLLEDFVQNFAAVRLRLLGQRQMILHEYRVHVQFPLLPLSHSSRR